MEGRYRSGWGVHGDFAVYAARRRPFLFNVRNSLDSLETEKLPTRALIRFLGRASTKAAAVIFNSRHSARQHEAIGYRAAQSRIIPNGFDCSLFRPDDESWRKVRNELGIAGSTFVVGHVARYHKIKDHATSIEAFSILSRTTSDACLVLAGLNVDEGNSEMASLIARFGIQGKVRLLGVRTDVSALNGVVAAPVHPAASGIRPDIITRSRAWQSLQPCRTRPPWRCPRPSGAAPPPSRREALAPTSGSDLRSRILRWFVG